MIVDDGAVVIQSGALVLYRASAEHRDEWPPRLPSGWPSSVISVLRTRGDTPLLG